MILALAWDESEVAVKWGGSKKVTFRNGVGVWVPKVVLPSPKFARTQKYFYPRPHLLGPKSTFTLARICSDPKVRLPSPKFAWTKKSFGANKYHSLPRLFYSRKLPEMFATENIDLAAEPVPTLDRVFHKRANLCESCANKSLLALQVAV